MSGNSISACGNDHPAWPRIKYTNKHKYFTVLLKFKNKN